MSCGRLRDRVRAGVGAWPGPDRATGFPYRRAAIVADRRPDEGRSHRPPAGSGPSAAAPTRTGRSSASGQGRRRGPADTRSRCRCRRRASFLYHRGGLIWPACARYAKAVTVFLGERNRRASKAQAVVDGYRGSVSTSSGVKSRSTPTRAGNRGAPARSTKARPAARKPASGRPAGRPSGPGRSPRRGPGPFSLLMRAITAVWRAIADLFGRLARMVGRNAATARDLDATHRRDGSALGVVALAVVLAAAIWWNAGGPAGGAIAALVRLAVGDGAVALPIVLLVGGVHMMRQVPHPEQRGRVTVGATALSLAVLGLAAPVGRFAGRSARPRFRRWPGRPGRRRRLVPGGDRGGVGAAAVPARLLRRARHHRHPAVHVGRTVRRAMAAPSASSPEGR